MDQNYHINVQEKACEHVKHTAAVGSVVTKSGARTGRAG